MNAVLPRLSRLSKDGAPRTLTVRGTRFGTPTFQPTDVVLAAIVGVVVIAFFPSAFIPRWTPRAVVYLAVLPWGILGLSSLVRRRDRAAIAAAGFIAAATVSALLAPGTFRSLLPSYYRHASVATWLAALGVWALAQQGSDDRRRLIQRSFVASLCLSVFVGVMQIGLDLDSGSLAMIGNRASGLTHNPVYLGALAAGAVAWCVRVMLTEDDVAFSRGGMKFVLTVSMLGLWIAGTRVAFPVVLIAMIAALVRSPRHFARNIAPWAVAGVVIGESVRLVNRIVFGGASTGATDRLGGSQVASGLGVRLEVWRFDLAAFARRPLFGHGPGQHPNAIQPHMTAEYASRTRPDRLRNNWLDAHNVVIELAVTVGVVGLLAALVFAAFHRRTVGGPGLWAAMAIIATWLMQPVSLFTMIPAMALLGSARTPAGSDGDRPPLISVLRGRGVPIVAALGFVCAGWLISADTLLVDDDERDVASGETIASLWWHDPMSAWEGAVLGLREAVDSGDPDDRERVLALAREMTERDPAFAFWWVQRGDIELVFGLEDEAWDSYERALEIQPWSRVAMVSILDFETDINRRAELQTRIGELDRLTVERRLSRNAITGGRLDRQVR